MKKIFISIVILLLLVSNSHAANFIEVYREDNYLIYVDFDSIEDKGSYVLAWSKWISRGEKLKEEQKRLKLNNLEYSLYYYAYDKNSKQSQLLAFSNYDSKGNVLESGNFQFFVNEYKYVVPQSLGEAVYEFVIAVYKAKNEPTQRSPQPQSSTNEDWERLIEHLK